MLTVIDLIQSQDETSTKNSWNAIAQHLAQWPGFQTAQLLKTVKTIHPQGDYKLTSFSQWDSEVQFQDARSAARADAAVARELTTMNAKFTAFRGVRVQGEDFAGAPHAQSHLVLVDVISLSEERADGYAAMWTRAREFMRTKAGYVGATLYRTIDSSSAVRFVNIAEWETPEYFNSALNTPEFFAIVDDYKADFALYLSQRIDGVVARSLGKAV